MAQGRRELEGLLAAWHLCGVVMLLSGKPLAPAVLNPFRGARPDSPALARIKAASAQIGWRILTQENRAK